jgi:ribosomal protein S18 acetylase RimI-like enzyme
MTCSESLVEFRDAHARAVAGWATSFDEVRRWAGGDAGWPFDVSALIGYGEVWTDEDEHEVKLGRIIIDPASRGLGVGRHLVRLLLERDSHSGYPDPFVRVVPGNRAAIACYRSAGFSRVQEAEREEYNRGQPVDYIWMRHPLISL